MLADNLRFARDPPGIGSLLIACYRSGGGLAATLASNGGPDECHGVGSAQVYLRRRALLAIGLGDLADKGSPRHIKRVVDCGCFRPRVVLQYLNHQGGVIRHDHARLLHPQQPGLAFRVAECSRCIDGHIGLIALADCSNGRESGTDLKRDAGNDQLLAARGLDRCSTLGSSQALTVDRSMILMPGRASTSSGNVGPHMLSRAVVVTTIGSATTFAAFASATTLCFSSPVE